ncbi:carbamoyltransferase [Dechloromonas sp. A34]|uniref:carbamoyltransferase family protein n=1 Tax=Dechloromonas sp. A34 TaxID=447588 RepID=UPI0022498449|nr:carbamoyltransferase [Dechloromonas sp. A34]
MNIVGISAYYHDSAAALIVNGRIIAAAQEERFSRCKHDRRFPARALAYCLQEGGLSLNDVHHVVFYEKPFLKFDRLIETWLAFAPQGLAAFRHAMPTWLGERLFQKQQLIRALEECGGRNIADRLLFSEHHRSHAASAFYPSPFDDAAVLTLDGAGEWATTTLSIGSGTRLETLREQRFPHSLGLLYSAFTGHLGFAVNSGEYKLMGLAALGEPCHAQQIFDRVIDLKPDGSLRLDQSYFGYCTGLTMTSRRFEELFGPARQPGEALTAHHANLAASIQAVTEEVVLRLTRAIARDTGARNLCLAGGVALNCLANSRILRESGFEEVWIQPAAGDAGAAIGAALLAHHELGGDRPLGRGIDDMAGALLGPAYSQAEIEAELNKVGARYVVLDDPELIAATASALATGQIVGWMQGRMEFGPRALGNRSILADPRRPDMRDRLNLKIKEREAYRPFAPAILAEDVADWFAPAITSPYMLLTTEIATHRRVASEATGFDRLKSPLSELPAITHADHTARLQTVSTATNPHFHALLSEFKALTGCPVLVNTSFNGADEAIVCSPTDAYTCYRKHGLDLLVIGNCLLRREASTPD